MGDRLLIAAAQRLTAVLGVGATVARLGGDEFAAILGRGGDRAVAVADRVVDAFRPPILLGGYDVVVSASVGVATSARAPTAAGLLSAADTAMYAAKRSGKARAEIFDPQMRSMLEREQRLRGELIPALDRDEFHVVYQPILDLRSHRVVAAEALLRWDHPSLGTIAPARFISVAERSGAIVPIGAWAIGESISAAANWQHGTRRTIHVNVSAAQMRSPGFVRDVAHLLDVHGVDPGRLTVEMTETVFCSELDSATGNLAELRSVGVRIALDDFGAGRCSLSSLHRFRVDVIKIDRRLVAELDAATGGRGGSDRPGRRRRSLAESIVRVASDLDIVTIGEGVERIGQQRALRELGCDFGQGHLFAAPLDAALLPSDDVMA